MNYKDLKNKTIFDFCNDSKILSKVAEHPNPIGHRKYIEGSSYIRHAQMLQNLAVEMCDMELFEAAEKLEEMCWKEFHKESKKAMAEGCIIEP